MFRTQVPVRRSGRPAGRRGEVGRETWQEPRPAMNRGLTLLGGMGLGAALMYLLDPERGRRRRALARDKAVHLAHRTDDALAETSRDLSHRAQGLAATSRARFSDEAVPDEVLVARVRSKIGRVVSHPHAIAVTAEQGRVTLSGPVLRDEADNLLAAVASVRGVAGVENGLEVHDGPGDVPALQGGSRRRGDQFELLQANWSPAARLLAGSAGGGLALVGLQRRGPVGAALGATGLGLLARALTNLELKRLVGLGGGRRAIDIQKTINVHAPVEEVFTFWTNFANFPRFMEHVREVRDLGEGRSHWTVTGPAGLSVEWDAVVTRLVPNKLVAWQSVPGSVLANAGVVRFDANPDGSTRVTVRLSYNPPAGALGHVVATLFGADPKQEMDDDLVRFKSLLEQGKTTAHRHAVTRDELVNMSRGQGSPPAEVRP